MATKVGVGFSEIPNSRNAAIAATTNALAQIGKQECDLAFLISTPKHDPHELHSGVRSVVGNSCNLVGGCSNGVITSERMGYEGPQVGVLVLSSDTIDVDMCMEEGLPDNEFNVGTALGKQIKNKLEDKTNLLLLVDAIKSKPTEEIRLNGISVPSVLEGLKQSLGTWPPTAGYALIGDWQFRPAYQFCNNFVGQRAAIATLLHGNVEMDSTFIYGMVPSSDYYTITKIEDRIILEIDNEPAVKVITRMMDIEPKDLIDYMIVLGVNLGERFEKFDPENNMNLFVMRYFEESGGILIHRPDVKEGMQFQLMRHNFADFDYLRERCESLLNRVKNKNCLFALYFPCTIRARAYSMTEGEEGEVVRDIIGSRMPLLGIYTGGEIGQGRNGVKATIYNALLCIVSENDKTA